MTRQDRLYEKYNKIVKARGGVLLSTAYVNAKVKLEVKCSNSDHPPWRIKSTRLTEGGWCRKCSDITNGLNHIKDKTKDLTEIAKRMEGTIEYFKYTGLKCLCKCTCKFGHSWEIKAGSLLSGKWCPNCSEGRAERICRYAMEQLFGDSFPKKRPTWLKTDCGRSLELDGYCEKLGIAFEHQGQQHFKLCYYNGKDQIRLDSIVCNDKLKLELCSSRGTKLLQIPELGTMLKIEELVNFIKKWAFKFGLKLTRKNIDLLDIKNAGRSFSGTAIEELKVIAHTKNGKLLSTTYLKSNLPLKWLCLVHNTSWKATASAIRKGQWCSQCQYDKRKPSISTINKIAESRGGRCLSKVYVNSRTPILWKCHNTKHIPWQAKPSQVIRKNGGSWCPECSKEYNITNLQNYWKCKRRGAKC